MDELTKHEIEVLRVAAGEEVEGFFWGASVAACLEHLVARGLVSRGPNHVATRAGRDLLASRNASTA